jgi:hypothetical protein
MPVQALILDDNSLGDWAALRPLSRLPGLQRLSLAGNSIFAVQHCSAGVIHAMLRACAESCSMHIHSLHGSCMPSCVAGPGFAALQSLNLGNNRLTDWASVDALSEFPNLSELRLSGNPLLPAAACDARFEVLPLCVLPSHAYVPFSHAS